MFRRTCLIGIVLIGSFCMAGRVYAQTAPGSTIEVREGDTWSKAKVLAQDGGKTQVQYDDGTTEWVTADRLRTPGSAPAGGTPAAPPPVPVTMDGPNAPISLDGVLIRKVPTGAAVPITPTTRPAGNFTPFKPKEDAGGVGKLSKLMIVSGTPWIAAAIGENSEDLCQLALLDTSTGGAYDVRSVPADARDVFGVADGGRVVFTRPSTKWDNPAILHVWEYANNEYTLKANYELVARGGTVKIEYAFAIDARHVVVGVNNDMMFLLDLPTKHAMASIKKDGPNPRLHGSGKIIECANALLRASDLQIITEFKPWSFPIPSVDPTGTTAAYASSGALNIMKLPLAAPTTTLPGVLNDADPIRLLNANTVMLGKAHRLIDLKTGVPIWQYAVPSDNQSLPLSNGQTLFAFSNGNATTFAMANLPDPAAAGVLKSAKDESYVLLPGVNIQVQGDLSSIYGDKAADAKKAIEKSITNAGDKVVDASPHYQLSVTSAPGKSQPQSYEFHMGPYGPNGIFHVDAPSTVVTLTLNLDGQPIWTRVINYQALGLLSLQNGQTVQDAVNAAAKPHVGYLNGMSLPRYIVKGATPGDTSPTLGSSTILPDGFDATPEK